MGITKVTPKNTIARPSVVDYSYKWIYEYDSFHKNVEYEVGIGLSNLYTFYFKYIVLYCILHINICR